MGYSTLFLGPRVISMSRDPGIRKLGRRQNSSIWSILAVFMGYSTMFLGPGVISMSRDTGYMKIGTSSKLVDLVISARFHGL